MVTFTDEFPISPWGTPLWGSEDADLLNKQSDMEMIGKIKKLEEAGIPFIKDIKGRPYYDGTKGDQTKEALYYLIMRG
ncbi:MAG: hypothetical protein OEX08_03230 [Candidatus Nomurabacteria bacterium]|nr:hypothetical protein [Candidatus Nomurabacteria bacterium]